MRSSPSSADALDRPRSRRLRPLVRLLGFGRPYLGRLLLAVAALLFAAGALLAFGQVIRHVVDSGLANGSPASLNRALLLFLLVVVLLSGAVGLRSWLLNWLGERIVADVRRAVFERALALNVGFFETTRTGEVISRLTSDTALLQTVVGSTFAMGLRSALLTVGSLVMLAITSPQLTKLVLLGVPLVLIPAWVLGHRVRRLSRLSQDRIGDVGAYVDESLHGIRTVQAFCHEPIDRARYGERVEEAFGTAMQRSLASALLSTLVTLLTFGAIGVVLWFGGREVLAGRITGGELSAFLFYAILVAGNVGALSDIAGQLLRGAGAAERLMELLETEPAITPPAHPQPLPMPVRGQVSAERLSFTYPSRPEHPALAHIDLEIAPGEQVALVGPSGAGKSTLFHLLLRFYDPQQGVLRLDGIDLRAMEPADFRRQIVIVPQDPVIFGADAIENIRYGLEADEAAVEAAARAAHAHEFIQRLPDGYRTFLGERGVRLSGGERQRIAIARAILRDPAVLLLDEATSALDAESERLVQDALEHLMQGRTSIVIAHRLATVRNADRILVLDQGRIVASGRHEQLLADGGLYARLAALQFQTLEAD
ncbi:ABC transporter transmembrane domain-containing protein [Lamprobacter modestohalophilus]|uniref:ABC transporter transmembrane domain-containing protein n=1 Tax=Lamprobacter modestohalophilus TaxID=1064514 RepID=UPI002ADEE199|nr:ABC transporter transmembrane domain-containing protein [Lamprobacter modestohalophilus]MEA1050777.1 ABC transporter transmembrane domain-containing protein [Lamprobacter modestohalophilus]